MPHFILHKVQKGLKQLSTVAIFDWWPEREAFEDGVKKKSNPSTDRFS
jgi:hypothetical protein